MLGRLIFFILTVFIFVNTGQSEASTYITKKSDTSKIVEKIEKEYATGKISKSKCTKKKSKALKLGKVSETICDNVEVKTVKKESKEEKKVEYIKKKEKKKKKAKKEFLKKTKDLSKKAKSWITKKVKKEKKHYKTIAQLPKSDFYFTATDDKGNTFIGYAVQDKDSKTIKAGNRKFKKFSNGQAFQDDGKTQCSVRSEVDKGTNEGIFTGQVLVKCKNKIFLGIWHQTGNKGFGVAQSESGTQLDFAFSMSRNDAVASFNKMKKESKETKKIVKLEKKLFEVKKDSKVDIAKLEKKLSENNLKIEDLTKDDSLLKLKKTDAADDDENLKKITKKVENEPPLITFTYNREDYESSADKNNPTVVTIEHANESYFFSGNVYDDGGTDAKQVTLLLEDKKKKTPIKIKAKGGSFKYESTSSNDKELFLVATDSNGKSSFILLQLKVQVASKSKFINDKKYYALIIGNSDYDKWDDLVSPANDTNEIARVLKEKYKFKVTLLQNATKDKIVDALWDLNKKLTEEDYLLIYYAGHGSKDSTIQKAYWIPKNAKEIDEPGRYWLSTSIVTENVGRFKARHVLLMVDSCYSGITIKGDDNIKADAERDLENPLYFKKMLNRKARLFISSGGDAPVPDTADGKHSLFAKKFIEVLQLNNSNIDSEEVFIKVKKYVQNNSSDNPRYRPIKDIGHNEGVFIFSARN